MRESEYLFSFDNSIWSTSLGSRYDFECYRTFHDINLPLRNTSRIGAPCYIFLISESVCFEQNCECFSTCDDVEGTCGIFIWTRRTDELIIDREFNRSTYPIILNNISEFSLADEFIGEFHPFDFQGYGHELRSCDILIETIEFWSFGIIDDDTFFRKVICYL